MKWFKDTSATGISIEQFREGMRRIDEAREPIHIEKWWQNRSIPTHDPWREFRMASRRFAVAFEKHHPFAIAVRWIRKRILG